MVENPDSHIYGDARSEKAKRGFLVTSRKSKSIRQESIHNGELVSRCLLHLKERLTSWLKVFLR
jgi:hypothetical protein